MKVVTINGTFAGDKDVSVHRADCKDVAKATRGRDYFTEEYESKRALWLDYNADFLAEGGESSAWPVHFLPCTAGLPDGGYYGKA